jgi:hypothetical protein
VHPWIAAAPSGELAVAWFSSDDAGAHEQIAFARGLPSNLAQGKVPTTRSVGDTTGRNTDFPNFALGPSGKAEIVWSDTSVWITTED